MQFITRLKKYLPGTCNSVFFIYLIQTPRHLDLELRTCDKTNEKWAFSAKRESLMLIFVYFVIEMTSFSLISEKMSQFSPDSDTSNSFTYTCTLIPYFYHNLNSTNCPQNLQCFQSTPSSSSSGSRWSNRNFELQEKCPHCPRCRSCCKSGRKLLFVCLPHLSSSHLYHRPAPSCGSLRKA